jgi:hypothetical protein
MTTPRSETFDSNAEPIVGVGMNFGGSVSETLSFVLDRSRYFLRTIAVVDVLPLAFFTVIVRQYLWGVSGQKLAWMLSLLIAGLLWCLHLSEREDEQLKRPRAFWLLAAAPLLFVYLLSVPHPDTSFDVLNYHLVNGERALRGWPFIFGDFFPTVIQVNPAPDMVSAIFRQAFGYRVGTIVNYLAILWIAMIVDKFLRSYVRNHWLRGLAVLVVVSTEMLLYLLNYYLIDLFALPLLLEATYLTLNFDDLRRKSYAVVQIAFFLALSVTFKITNLAFVAPIAILCALKIFRNRRHITPRYIAIASVVLVAPMLPFAWFMFRETGNPFFPLLNAVFKSPYLAPHNWDDPAHGPKKWWEVLAWPILTVIYPERLSEMSGLITGYTGRIAIAYVVSIMGIATPTLDKKLRSICFLLLAGSLFWSVTTGNGRYGLYLELMGGIAAVGVLFSVLKTQMAAAMVNEARRITPKLIMLVVLFGGLLLMQSVISYRHVYHHVFLRTFEGTTLLGPAAELRSSLYESRSLLRDHSLKSGLSNEQLKKLDEVDVWVNSAYTTNGFEILLKPEVPIISVSDYIRTFDLLETEGSKQKLSQTLSSLKGKRMFTLVPTPYLPSAVGFAKRAGLNLGPATPFDLPFFSECNIQTLNLIELTPAN